MDIHSKLQLTRIQPLDREIFQKIQQTEFRPSFDLMGLKYLREKAGKERDLRELYRGRAPYELLQNADDSGAKQAVFILCREGLVFAHDGTWFTVDNFRSLADGWSDKDPGECIGHKGLGFRSVLDLTPSPYLLRLGAGGFFSVKFSWGLNNGHIQESLRRSPSAVSEYQKWTKHGQIVCPIMAIPGLAQKNNLGMGAKIYDDLIAGGYGDQLTTMFWLPARDPELQTQVLEALSPVPIFSNSNGKNLLLEFLRDEVSILIPFLASVQKVSIYDDTHRLGYTAIPSRDQTVNSGVIQVMLELDGKSSTKHYFQARYSFPIPVNIRNQADTPKAVKAMKEAKLVLAVRVEENHPIAVNDAQFHVYFPTEDTTGVGFIIHGDFYVKPDRTRLMENSPYNIWLLECAAQKAANEFLTQLLNRYPSRHVFNALAPTGQAVPPIAKSFIDKLAIELVKRQEPFIPSKNGLLPRSAAVLPPASDSQGFWEFHFSDTLNKVLKDKFAFLDHREDGVKTRAFLRLAQALELSTETILDFIEAEVATGNAKSSSWWYECYTYLANDDRIVRSPRSVFEGRKLLPLSGGQVLPVPKESIPIVCLPPNVDLLTTEVPTIFAAIFNFLDPTLAKFIEDGDERVKNWILTNFRIARFEATDLLPRAIRSVAAGIYNGEHKLSFDALALMWKFVKTIVGLSPRAILSQDFWQEIGRLPLPNESTGTRDGKIIDSQNLIPTFLCYWPDSYLDKDASIRDVMGLRRANAQFLDQLVEKSGEGSEAWIEFFERAGVSRSPKLLTFRRLAVGGQSVSAIVNAPMNIGTSSYRGESQFDENVAVIDALKGNSIWDTVIVGLSVCSHDSSKELQQLSLIDGFEKCAQKAQQEYSQSNLSWSDRLWSLVTELPEIVLGQDEDKFICLGGRQGSHTITAYSYIKSQLENELWLPTSLGPAGSGDCFSRLITRRLISTGRSEEELGDLLLPYIIANNIIDLGKLEKLGIQRLEDVESSSPQALVRALVILGDNLQTDWSKREILEVRSRWRLVRGAIQEIYRRLNQISFDPPDDLSLAIRSSGKVEFRKTPIYYAEPGSAVERAFSNVLPLFDADRTYAELFRLLNIIPLVPGLTVVENFKAADRAIPADSLCSEIVDGLAPYLLAPILAKSDKAKTNRSDLILRRLRERFEVRTVESLSVSFTLISDPSIEQGVDYQNFYIQRTLVSGAGVIQEANYVLYIAGNENTSFSEIDADALGEAISTVFLDGLDSDLAGLFPRITARYQQLSGDQNGMEEYLYSQLEISKEAQEDAQALFSGEDTIAPPLAVPVPPPAQIIQSPTRLPEETGTGQEIAEQIQTHQQKLEESTSEFAEELLNLFQPQNGGPDTTRPGTHPRRRHPEVTPAQEARGKKGEIEIKRRLQSPGGWEGFLLLADKRDDGCGYDFLCSLGDQEVYLEVKTFIRNGRVVVSSNELQVAAASQDSYFLIGILDDEECPEYDWKTFIVQNPLRLLLKVGEFDIQPKLQALAEKVFGLSADAV